MPRWRGGERERWEMRQSEENDFRNNVLKSSPGLRYLAWSQLHQTFTVCLSVCLHEREKEGKRDGESLLAGVDLGPNHTHDLLLHFGLLGVDVGISYLAILVPARTQERAYTCYLFPH